MSIAEVAADIEFSDMSGPQLVESYNEMLQTWVDLGGDNRYSTVRRFSTQETGRRRCLALHEAICVLRAERTERAPEPPTRRASRATIVPADTPPRRGRGRPAAPPAQVSDPQRSLASYTEEFNGLVTRANELGLHWARMHTSLFESRASGARQLARLKQAIADAESRVRS